jgi:hypothetical protein
MAVKIGKVLSKSADVGPDSTVTVDIEVSGDRSGDWERYFQESVKKRGVEVRFAPRATGGAPILRLKTTPFGLEQDLVWIEAGARDADTATERDERLAQQAAEKKAKELADLKDQMNAAIDEINKKRS